MPPLGEPAISAGDIPHYFTRISSHILTTAHTHWDLKLLLGGKLAIGEAIVHTSRCCGSIHDHPVVNL